MKTANSAQKQKTIRTFFQRFGLFFYDRLKTTGMLWILLVVFGFLSYAFLMQRQGFPNVEVPLSVVNGTYFINNKIEVDASVVKPLSELGMKQPNIKSIKATAGANFFNLIFQYKDGTNAKTASANFQHAVEDAGFLPSKVTVTYEPINGSKFANKYDVMLALHASKTTTAAELSSIGDRIATSFKDTVGVASVNSINPFKTGTNPISGQSVTLQETFDQVGIRENNQTVFYPSIELGILSKAGTDVIHLEKNLNDRIAYLESQPENAGLHIVVSAGVAENITSQISNLQTNLIEGLIVVIIISLLLISWRAGLATALSMASVLLITVGVLYVLGITLNTITLFALVLCLGLIVDDTTIMAEAIDAGRKSGASNREIVATAMKRVARASTAGTLVTMLAFAPMLFISGVLGSFIRVLPITIIISLAVSLLISLTLIPFLSRRLLLSKSGKKSHERNPVIKVENWISNGLAQLIRVGQQSHKKAASIGIFAIVISFVFLIGSGVFFSKLKFDIFPATKDSDSLTMGLTYPAGTQIEAAQNISNSANDILAQNLGENLKQVSYLNSGSTISSNAVIHLVSFKKRHVKSPQMVVMLNTAFANFSAARVKVSQSDVGPPKDDYPFRVQIYGENTADTTKLASDVASYLKEQTITRTNGTTARVARTQLEGSGDTINRTDSRRLIEVQAGFDADDTSALVATAQKTVQNKFTTSVLSSYGVDSKNVTFNFGNESNNQDSFKSMLYAFPILLIIMFLLLAFQFKSLLQPLLIFTAIPFSFFGVSAGLYVTNNPLSFFVMIGFFALIGIAVNNTILLTDFANQARKQGEGRFESMALAVKARFRPLIATSLTGVLALIPLALSDPFWESLSYTLIFGLLSSMFLVVIAFPYFYLAAEFLRSRYSRRLSISWLLVVVVTLVVLARYKAALIPLAMLLFVVALTTTWLKGIFQKRLQSHQSV